MENNKYYQSRHFLRLLHRYEKAVSEGSVPYFEADELTDIAEYYMTDKQDAKADQAIQAAIRMHPDSVDPQIFLARQKMFYGQFDEARAIIEAISEQEDTEVAYIQAELLIREDKPQEASSYLTEQLERMLDCLDIYLYNCTSIFMDYDEWEQAKEWLDRLKEAFPTHPQLPIMEAEILMGLNEYEKALSLLIQIRDEEPYNSEAWNLLAETYIALGMYADALEAADFSLAVNPQDCNAILMKGNAYMHDKQMNEAVECYKQYLESQPDDLSVHISLALSYSSEERYQEALPTLDRAEQLARELPYGKEDLPQILEMRAIALNHLNRVKEAIAATEQARECCKEDEAWRIDLLEADIYLQCKQKKIAEYYFTRALEKSPEKPETLFNIAVSHSYSGYNDAAIELFNDVWTICGTQEGKFVVPHLANCYLQKNDMENFLSYLKLAPFCDRETTQLLFHERFPGIAPEEYYAYAYKEIHGVFPPNNL